MRGIFALLTGLVFGAPAFASRPEDGQLGFQPAATPVMEQIHWFHNALLMPIITGDLAVCDVPLASRRHSALQSKSQPDAQHLHAQHAA